MPAPQQNKLQFSANSKPYRANFIKTSSFQTTDAPSKHAPACLAPTCLPHTATRRSSTLTLSEQFSLSRWTCAHFPTNTLSLQPRIAFQPDLNLPHPNIRIFLILNRSGAIKCHKKAIITPDLGETIIMPVYIYRCESCGVQFEKHQSFTEDPLKKCPECSQLSLRKVLTPAGIVFKGSGWYATDHKSASGSRSLTKTESKESSAASTPAPASSSDSSAAAPSTPSSTPSTKE